MDFLQKSGSRIDAWSEKALGEPAVAGIGPVRSPAVANQNCTLLVNDSMSHRDYRVPPPDDLGDIANLGLTLAEGKLLLAGLQQAIVAAQATWPTIEDLIEVLDVPGKSSGQRDAPEADPTPPSSGNTMAKHE